MGRNGCRRRLVDPYVLGLLDADAQLKQNIGRAKSAPSEVLDGAAPEYAIKPKGGGRACDARAQRGTSGRGE